MALSYYDQEDRASSRKTQVKAKKATLVWMARIHMDGNHHHHNDNHQLEHVPPLLVCIMVGPTIALCDGEVMHNMSSVVSGIPVRSARECQYFISSFRRPWLLLSNLVLLL